MSTLYPYCLSRRALTHFFKQYVCNIHFFSCQENASFIPIIFFKDDVSVFPIIFHQNMSAISTFLCQKICVICIISCFPVGYREISVKNFFDLALVPVVYKGGDWLSSFKNSSHQLRSVRESARARSAHTRTLNAFFTAPSLYTNSYFLLILPPEHPTYSPPHSLLHITS